MLRRNPTVTVLLLMLGWAALLLCGQAHATERYEISLPKSQFQFKGYSLLAKALGTFHSFSGEILANAETVSASQVRFVIDAKSLDTNNEKRDNHLRSEDFLFVEKHPTITFVSTAIVPDGSGYTVQGDLQLRGVTKRITIPVTVEQRQNELIVQGRMQLNRRDFGVNYNAFFNPVQNEVDVLFTIVGVKP
jgi:polyisoprenoid-binding protein YceI